MNDHGIIDYDPYREDQTQHGDVVEREPHNLHK